MKSPDSEAPGCQQGPAEAHPDAAMERRLAAAVRDAFAGPCPDLLTGRILTAVRSEERVVRAWPARWLFALPVLEVALLVLLRTDVASALSQAGRLWTPVREAALPNWQGAVDAAQFCWLTTRTWLGYDLPLQPDLLPWIVAALLAVILFGTLIFRQERSHA